MEQVVHEAWTLRRLERRKALARSTQQWRQACGIDDGVDRSEVAEDDMSNGVEELRWIASRNGFLQAQLEMDSLRPLKRWHAQLKLMEADSAEQAKSKDDESSSPTSTIDRALSALAIDRPCFDLVYARDARVSDLRATLVDGHEHVRPDEALAFSSTKDGQTSRVVLFVLKDPSRVVARCSHYVPDLEQTISRLIEAQAPVQELVDDMWRQIGLDENQAK